jgi:hypothetical protein
MIVPKMGFSLWAMPANSEFLVAAMTTKPCYSKRHAQKLTGGTLRASGRLISLSKCDMKAPTLSPRPAKSRSTWLFTLVMFTSAWPYSTMLSATVVMGDSRATNLGPLRGPRSLSRCARRSPGNHSCIYIQHRAWLRIRERVIPDATVSLCQYIFWQSGDDSRVSQNGHVQIEDSRIDIYTHEQGLWDARGLGTSRGAPSS